MANSVEATRTTTTITDSLMEVNPNKDSAETPITNKVAIEQVEATRTTTTTKEAVATTVTPKVVGTAITVISLEEKLNKPNKVKEETRMVKMFPRDKVSSMLKRKPIELRS